MTETTSPSQGKSFGFRPARGIPRGPLMALAISAALAAWMYSAPGHEQAPDKPREAPAPKVQAVRAVVSEARPMTALIPADGETRAWRKASLTARASGIVEVLHVGKGDEVAAGDPILTLDVPDFDAREAAAAAKLEEAKRDLEKRSQLQGRGIVTQDSLQSAKTALAQAEAAWATIEEERTDRVLRAPFAGTVSELDIEIGDSVTSGATIGRLLDLSTIIVDITIPQANIGNVHAGQRASVRPTGSDEMTGVVGFIAPEAVSATRSFPVEIQIANRDGNIRAGLSAAVKVEGREAHVHQLPSAYLSLSESGELLVKTVEEGKVKAVPVLIVSSGLSQVSVTGLPDKATIITVGQGFVRDGDPVSVEIIQ